MQNQTMKTRTWLILGATSQIAEEFAHLAAQAGHSLLLVGRNVEQLEIITADIRLRYSVDCQFMVTDFSLDLSEIIDILQHSLADIDLFIAHSAIITNNELNQENISQLIKINIQSTIQLIHVYMHRLQTQHRLIFLSSVSACRGRSKNSLYGASKAAVEIYLEGLQQTPLNNRQITIARLGFIDTAQTFGLPRIFYASPPKACAKACWLALRHKKRLIYHPSFWRFIMAIIRHLPFFIYRKIKI